MRSRPETLELGSFLHGLSKKKIVWKSSADNIPDFSVKGFTREYMVTKGPKRQAPRPPEKKPPSRGWGPPKITHFSLTLVSPFRSWETKKS
jgi:hypothetical protein